MKRKFFFNSINPREREAAKAARAEDAGIELLDLASLHDFCDVPGCRRATDADLDGLELRGTPFLFVFDDSENLYLDRVDLIAEADVRVPTKSVAGLVRQQLRARLAAAQARDQALRAAQNPEEIVAANDRKQGDNYPRRRLRVADLEARLELSRQRREQARASAMAKLRALGLTDDEIEGLRDIAQ